MKKLAPIIILVLVTALLAACGGTPNTQSKNPNTITMGAASFSATSITITKGSTITFVNNANTGALHIVTTGQNGQNEAESNAPDFGGAAGHRSDVGDNWTTPPWNTAGTFHVTCTVHPEMNLTVIVTN